MLALHSPAKVDLFLRVVGKLPDGRPDTVALSQAVDLCDTLDFARAEADHMESQGVQLTDIYSRALWSAVELFRKKTGKQQKVKITLQKRIPEAAGLFAKSSNIATILFGLNQLSGRPATVSELKSWAKELTHDASFFFTSGAILKKGNDEEESYCNKLSEEPLLLATPFGKLPPSAVYKRLCIKEVERRDLKQVVDKAVEGRPEVFNDLEGAAFALSPKLALVKEKLLQSGCRDVAMSAAGPSFVCRGTVKSTPFSWDNVCFYTVLPIRREKNAWFTPLAAMSAAREAL